MFNYFYITVFLLFSSSILSIQAKTVRPLLISLQNSCHFKLEQSILNKPIVKTPISYIYGEKALPLKAEATSTNNLVWYTVKSGGVGSTVAPTPSTQEVGLIKYWVSQFNEEGLESERSSIDVYIKKANQKIKFDALGTLDLSKTKSIYLKATTSSRLPITYVINKTSTIATVDKTGFILLNEPGRIEITATQRGNKNYNAATSVKQILEIESSDITLKEITIDNVIYKLPQYDNTIEFFCFKDFSDVDIKNIKVQKGATVEVSKDNTAPISHHDNFYYRVKVTSQNKKVRQFYKFKFEKKECNQAFLSMAK